MEFEQMKQKKGGKGERRNGWALLSEYGMFHLKYG